MRSTLSVLDIIDSQASSSLYRTTKVGADTMAAAVCARRSSPQQCGRQSGVAHGPADSAQQRVHRQRRALLAPQRHNGPPLPAVPAHANTLR